MLIRVAVRSIEESRLAIVLRLVTDNDQFGDLLCRVRSGRHIVTGPRRRERAQVAHSPPLHFEYTFELIVLPADESRKKSVQIHLETLAFDDGALQRLDALEKVLVSEMLFHDVVFVENRAKPKHQCGDIALEVPPLDRPHKTQGKRPQVFLRFRADAPTGQSCLDDLLGQPAEAVKVDIFVT